ncbi:hypothetical protein I7I53_08167 [Histoplasma capsulatum var. duboisii H88]|uniref:Uncharacterized protein n=1 Tax=Ajellomyces capsulatus (strain H88) TaxID=544711 RepID=A0A8A1LDN0_AJEC8|nr:hypothetical protein I7I53_08167 [Histoplasma capsulatum var. duboisii H88]
MYIFFIHHEFSSFNHFQSAYNYHILDSSNQQYYLISKYEHFFFFPFFFHSFSFFLSSEFSIFVSNTLVIYILTIVTELISKREVYDMLYSVETDTNGILHLADDGILRSFDETGNVIDYRRLNNSHLRAVASLYSKDINDYLLNIWNNIDGFAVEEKAIWHPPTDLYPLPLLQKSQSISSSITHHSLLHRIVYCADVHCTGHSTCRNVDCELCIIVDQW